MKKGTKKIRKVFTGENTYYVYDLDIDITGKRKRLYARTESELKEKIEESEKEKKLKDYYSIPTSTKLSEYIQYYFKTQIGNMSLFKLDQLKNLAKQIIFESNIDKEINKISPEDIYSFYKKIGMIYDIKIINDISKILINTLKLVTTIELDISTNSNLLTKIIPLISSAQKEASNKNILLKSYILSPEEYNYLLNVCIEDNCKRYGENERIIIFCLLTGLPFSKIKTITYKDVDLSKGIIKIDDNYYMMTDKCRTWLSDMENEMFFNSSENMSISRYNQPLFVNKYNNSPTLQSIQSTIYSITSRCGLPKKISGKSLCKSFIINELYNGISEEVILERFNKKDAQFIKNIKNEYKMQQLIKGGIIKENG